MAGITFRHACVPLFARVRQDFCGLISSITGAVIGHSRTFYVGQKPRYTVALAKEAQVKKTFLVLLIGAFPALATACGDDANENNAAGDDVVSETDSAHASKPHGHDADGGDTHAMKPHGHDGDSAHDAKPHGHDSDSAHDAKPHEHGSNDGSGTGHDDHDSVVGRPGNPENISRTVEVAMNDTMRFTPDQFTVGAGETIQFAVRNDGQIAHEFVIGSMSEMMEHAKMMRTMPTMQHAEANMITLASGETGNVTWQFDQAGTVDFACLIPGHFEAGMKGSIKVE